MKVPLVGGSGKVLWEALRRQGISRAQCYITNVYKRRVSDSEKVDTNEQSHWFGLLQWELQQLRSAKYILVLGGDALECILGYDKIDAWRGTCLENLGKWYVISHNPANVIRKPELEVIFQLDMAKLSLIRSNQWKSYDIKAHYDLSAVEYCRWIERFHDEKKPIAFDIETSANETACIGFANDPHEGVCLNWRTKTGHRHGLYAERSLRKRLAQLLSDSNVRLVGQNANFDSYWLWYKDRLRVWKVWLDTLLAHHTLYPTLPHNLGFLTSQYTTHPYYKDERETWREGGDIGQYWTYNVKDCCITLAVAERLRRELEEQRLWNFYQDHVMRLNPHCAAMTVYGIKVDRRHKEYLNNVIGMEVEAAEAALLQAARVATQDPAYTFNPLSHHQVRDLLFGRLRLVGRGTSTDETNRKYMYNHAATPDAAKSMLRSFDTYKEKQKFHSTYVETAVDEDDRYRAEWKQFGVAKTPGRLSSSGNLWGTAGNAQNQPENARGMWIADPGYKFVYFDLRQAEAKLVAYFANIASWKEQFEKAMLEPDKFDAHRALCSEMWGIPYEETPKKDTDAEGRHTLRYVAKRCRHGLNYRMEPSRLAETTGLTLLEATDAYVRYHRATPELRVWWKKEIDTVVKEHCLYNPLGRRLLFLGRIDTTNEEQLESVVAFKPQSTVGDHVCSVIYKSHDDPKWPRDAHILHDGHDSLTALCRIGDEMRTAEIMKRYAEQPIYINGEECIIPADVKVSAPLSEHELHRWNVMKGVRV